jgi:uncharacterized membrane protein
VRGLSASIEIIMKRYLIPVLISVLALAGVVVSVLALRVHYTTGVQICSINEKWDCGIVNHSPFAEIFGIPVATLGIVGYLALAGLALAGQRALLFLANLIGIGFALYLTFIEEFVLQVWCLYCVISQGIIGLLLLLSFGWLAVEYIGLKWGAKARA